MINKPFDEIQAADLEALVANEVPEGRTLEYKQQLPGSSDADKREFLADVSSFANAAAGDLLFGVPERRDHDGKTTGIPAAVSGLAGVNVDQEIRRLDETIRTGIEPTIIGVRIRTVGSFPEGPVLVVRIPKSWAAPHMVTYKGSSSFYTRDARGKHRMDVHEIRHAFALTEALPEKIRRFRDERLARIVAGETPVVLPNLPKLVLHLLPLSALDSTTRLNLSSVESKTTEFKPLYSSGWSPRYNFDGFLIHTATSESLSTSYVQIFRTGALETVEATMLRPHEGQNLISP